MSTYESTFEGYMMFRMSEAEHMAQYETTTDAVSTVNVEYVPEVSAYDAYILDASAAYDNELHTLYGDVDERG